MRFTFLPFLITAVLIAGCSSPKPAVDLSGTSQPSVGLSIHTQNATQSAERAQESIEEIADSAEDIAASSTQPEIQNTAQDIIRKTDSIESDVNDLMASLEEIEAAVEDVQNVEQQNAVLSSEDQRVQNEAKASLFGWIGGVFALGMTAVIGGIITAFFFRKLGIMIVMAGLVTVATAAGAIYYLPEIALVGFVLVIAAILGGLYVFIRSLKESNDTNQVLAETLDEVESTVVEKETVRDIKKKKAQETTNVKAMKILETPVSENNEYDL